MFLGARKVISVIAHRGASAVCRENTVDAFLEARRRGADGVELDVRRGAGGALVVHHDPALPDGRPILNLAVADLPNDIPLLEAAVEACDGMLVNIEIKNVPIDPDFDPDESVAGAVAALVIERGWVGRILVSSFTMATIDTILAAEPAMATGWLTPPGYDQLRALETAAAHGHAALHPYFDAVTAELVEAAHEAGLAINTWTVDDPDRMRALADMGVDAVITNVPDIAVAALAHWRT